MFIDCHAHLYQPKPTKESLNNLIEKAKEKNVKHIVGAIVNPEKYHFYEIQQSFENIIHVLGVYAFTKIIDFSPSLSSLRTELEKNKPHGIGELTFWNTKETTIQRRQHELARKQIQLAIEYNIPVVTCASFGTGNALVRILKEEHAEEVGGQIHCTRNSMETVKELLDMGFFMSFGSSPTVKEPDPFANKKIIELMKFVPLDQFLTETDAPAGMVGDPPVPRVSPADVESIARNCASLKEVEIKDFAFQIMKNARKLFKF